jgi:membrane fusion protein
MVVRREQKDESGANATAAIAGLQTDKSDADRRDLSASLAQSGIDRAGAEKRREGIARRIAQERQVLDLERRKAGIAKASYERVQPLLADRLISEVDVRKYETSWIEAEEAALASQQRIDSMEGDLSDARAAVAKLSEQEKAYRARLDAQGAEAGIEKLSQEAETSFSVVAPVGGTVTGITARTGDAVAAQMPLAVIVPDGALLAELFVPSSAIGFVKPGGKVKLMVDAFPYQKFGFRNGAIATVSLAPVPQQARAQEQAEPMFVVQVRLDRQDMPAYGRSWALLPGMKVTADIVLEDRSFLEWLFDPVRATMMRL